VNGIARRRLCVTITAGAAIAAVVAATTAAARFASTVRSSLDGKTTLPYRIAWNAYPSAPSARIKEVDFLVDGKVLWVEHHAPYNFADGDGFVTTWLAPGTHRFAVRAVETSGASSIDTILARVLTPPAPPAPVGGTWRRDVDTSSLQNPPGVENPSGTYTLVIDKRWIQARFPGRFVPGEGPKASIHNGYGWIIDAYATYRGSTITIPGTVNFQLLTNDVREGGWWCGPNHPANYRWAVHGDTLTLTAVRDGCAGRKLIWSGDWTRG
jgi:hypothetical protein